MKRFFILLAVFSGIASPAWAEELPKTEVPRLINMQSLIFDKDGNLSESEKVDLTFRIVDEKNNVLYTEVQTKIPVVKGAVNVTIGEQARGIPLEAVDPSTGPKFLDVLVDGTDPFELMPLTSVPYALWAEKALKVPDDSITTKQIKNGTIRPEDLDPAFSFANVSGQAADGQIPATVARLIDLTNHINAPAAHQAIQIGVNQNFGSFLANNVQQAFEKIDWILRDEVFNRKSGVDFTYKGLKKEVADRETAVKGHADLKVAHGSSGEVVGKTTLDKAVSDHAALKTGIHGLKSTDPSSAIVGTTEEQTLSKKTLVTPKVAGDGKGIATLKYSTTDKERSFLLPVPPDPVIEEPLVSLSAVQTLSGKTLLSPAITDFTSATHSHKDAAGGGTLDTSAISSGTLPVTRGGTGATTSTGSGSVVLGTSPTLTTPAISSFISAKHSHQSDAGGGTLDAAAIASGTLSDARLSSNVSKLGSSIESSEITDGTIGNADISSDPKAAIATSKLSGAVTSIASHGLGGLATLGAVSGGTGGTITDNTITNADIADPAVIKDLVGIAWGKIDKTGALPSHVGAAAASHGHAWGDVSKSGASAADIGAAAAGHNHDGTYVKQIDMIPLATFEKFVPEVGSPVQEKGPLKVHVITGTLSDSGDVHFNIGAGLKIVNCMLVLKEGVFQNFNRSFGGNDGYRYNSSSGKFEWNSSDKDYASAPFTLIIMTL